MWVEVTAAHLAEELEYYDVMWLLRSFYKDQMTQDSRHFFLYQLKEAERVQKRKKKYEKKMNASIKMQINEYKKRIKFNVCSKSVLSMDSITIDENIVLTNASSLSARTLESVCSSSSTNQIPKNNSPQASNEKYYIPFSSSYNQISFV
jgi:hypothetical protein